MFQCRDNSIEQYPNFIELAQHKYNPEWSHEEEKSWVEACESVKSVEQKRRDDLQIQLSKSEAEWLEVFPEERYMVPIKIREWKEVRQRIEALTQEKIKFLQTFIFHSDFTPEIIEFYIEWILYLTACEIRKVNKHIVRLKCSLPMTEENNKAQISHEVIERARSTPLVYLIAKESQIKRSGKTFTLHCLFHMDKTPSFVVYPESNRFYCYGCNIHGDVIDYAMNRNSIGFREAVLYLTGGGE